MLLRYEEQVTDEEGVCSFKDIPQGEYSLYAYSDGSDIYTEPLVITDSMREMQLTFLLDLCIDDRMTVIEGEVMTSGGNPISDARISIGSLFLRTTSDSNGSYSLIVPPGDWVLSCYIESIGENVVDIECVGPDEPGMERPVIEMDIVIADE